MRLIDGDALKKRLQEQQRYGSTQDSHGRAKAIVEVIHAPTIEAEPVRNGRWIECDYKHIEHGFMETEPNAGLCCSECRAAFQKKKMTYKQYCAACGAKMDL